MGATNSKKLTWEQYEKQIGNACTRKEIQKEIGAKCTRCTTVNSREFRRQLNILEEEANELILTLKLLKKYKDQNGIQNRLSGCHLEIRRLGFAYVNEFTI